MIEPHPLICLIEDFQQTAKVVAEEFYNKYNRKDLLRAWHDKTIAQKGSLNDIVQKYAFHGAGLYAKLKGKEVDFDFGPDDRIDGFDAWRLKEFADSQKKYKDKWSSKSIESGLEELMKNGTIYKPGSHPGTTNYYLK